MPPSVRSAFPESPRRGEFDPCPLPVPLFNMFKEIDENAPEKLIDDAATDSEFTWGNYKFKILLELAVEHSDGRLNLAR